MNNHNNAPIRFTVTIERDRQQLFGDEETREGLIPSIREQGFRVTGIALLGDLEENGKEGNKFNIWLLEVVVDE